MKILTMSIGSEISFIAKTTPANPSVCPLGLFEVFTMSYPIFDSRDGRTVIGRANGVRSAVVQLRKMLTIPAEFSLYVWLRTDTMSDMLDLPVGFVYSIKKTA